MEKHTEAQIANTLSLFKGLRQDALDSLTSAEQAVLARLLGALWETAHRDARKASSVQCSLDLGKWLTTYATAYLPQAYTFGNLLVSLLHDAPGVREVAVVGYLVTVKF